LFHIRRLFTALDGSPLSAAGTALGATHLIDTVGVIFTDGASMAGRGRQPVSLHRAIEGSGLGRCGGLSDTFAFGKSDESKV
jgi:hypothetical protein